MAAWISANIADIIVVAVIAALVILVIVKMARDRRAGKTSCGCGGSCAGCAMSGKCHADMEKKNNKK